MISEKKVSESFTIMNELVLPTDTNPFNNLMGGRLLHMMDIAAAISAQKFSENLVVTVSVDNVSFLNTISMGDIVSIQAKVTRSFNTSLEVRLDVWAENYTKKTKIKSNEAYYTFVAIDNEHKPTKIYKAIAETEEEKALFNEAIIRRQIKLLMAKKIKPQEANELQSLLNTTI